MLMAVGVLLNISRHFATKTLFIRQGFSYVCKMQYVYRNKYNGNKKREAEELVVRVLVSGGGTGGHIYPALALIREIKS